MQTVAQPLAKQWIIAFRKATLAAYAQWVRENGITDGFASYGVPPAGDWDGIRLDIYP